MNGLLLGLLLPFSGTVLGAATVFLLRDHIPARLQKVLLGFASGVMIAASVWSLLIPAMDMNAEMGQWAVAPAVTGFLAGMAFLLLLDKLIPHLHLDGKEPEGPRSRLSRTTMLSLAVTLHNIPEGMAVGAVMAAAMTGDAELSIAAAVALSVGIAIQNIPEGAIISMPMLGEGHSKIRSFSIGALSGIVEPISACITILLAAYITPALPYLLAFSAGAMIYVVIEELIPEASQGHHSNIGTIGFAAGFSLMMILDVVLG